jgi:hypothetical protein
MDGLIEGRIVHYVLLESYAHDKGEHRPAIIVKVFESIKANGTVNMVVFLDGYNDTREEIAGKPVLMAWATSVHYSESKEPGTWHWPERA